MVNFNTNEIKVAFYEATAEIQPLSQSSTKNMVAAIIEAFDCKSNVVLVFAFCRHFLPAKAGHQIHETVKSKGGNIVSFHPALVIMTPHGKSITVYFIGGIGTFFLPAPDSSEDESSVEVTEVRRPELKRSNHVPNHGRDKRTQVPTQGRTTTSTTAPTHSNNASSHRNKNATSTKKNHRHSNNDDVDSSFENTVGLTQELF
jgi:hypothetical protein